MKVLVATDGSKYAARAADFLGARLRPDAPIDLDIVAVPEQSPDPSEGGGDVHRWIDRAARSLSRNGVTPGVRSAAGEPAAALLEAASDYDLVVAGVKGRGAAPFFELGSVASALLREAETSILLVRDRRPSGGTGRGSAPEASAEGDPFRVLLPTDGADRGLAAAWELLGPFAVPETEVEVATVVEPRGTAADGRPAPASWEGEPRTEVRSRARRWLQRAVGTLPPAAEKTRSVLLEGRPAREIAQRAQHVAADLIILGRGRNGRVNGSPSLGSTARELAWSAPCSVLLVRGP
jgi:nucleotide-binding universal stress UspA family protein